MPLSLADITNERQEQLDDAIRRANAESNATTSIAILLGALGQIRDAVSDAAIESVSVDNLDEVKASLRNELGRISKPLISAIESLKIPADQIERIRSDIERRNTLALSESHDIQIVRKPRQRITVDNLGDIQLPTMMSVTNLAELEQYFNRLNETLGSLNLSVEAPRVTVDAPIVNVPEIRIPDIQLPEITLPDTSQNLKPLLEAIKALKDSIRKSAAKQDRQAVAFSSGLTESSARKAFKTATMATLGGSGGLELTSAGTAVQLTATSTDCKWVDVSALDGLVAVGDSTAVQTAGSEVGNIIYPGNTPLRVYTDNVNKVYAAGATNTRVIWNYYV